MKRYSFWQILLFTFIMMMSRLVMVHTPGMIIKPAIGACARLLVPYGKNTLRDLVNSKGSDLTLNAMRVIGFAKSTSIQIEIHNVNHTVMYIDELKYHGSPLLRDEHVADKLNRTFLSSTTIAVVDNSILTFSPKFSKGFHIHNQKGNQLYYTVCKCFGNHALVKYTSSYSSSLPITKPNTFYLIT